MMIFWCWYFDDDDVDVLMMFSWWCFHDDVSDPKIRVWWWCCCWSKGQSVEEDVSDLKVKVLKMMLLIERSKCWRWCCWSKGQSVEDVADRKVKVLKMLLLIEVVKVLMMLKTKDWRWRLHDVESFQWFIDVSSWWCWWCPLSLSYYCCCWCCYRIPFSLRGSVEIL